ncbi:MULTISPECIES: GGDEF domain-containing protein [unclassified Aureimonas]|uniref:sensor domain-containing diguanylate cyclase n=1 Tax=unclassified Aureimonas TaxID=2615206 RepID=UPI00070137DD|nr:MULTISPECIES: GGDEF domain-containing protein [unclassified Aureimonas]KQT61858.1 hypothetical protein ASG62_23835 [Aureimonas sp. Leaf427]KQT74889.1 hypothetical protein ASG54_03575 [Aureimonas sp. Leaf460]
MSAVSIDLIGIPAFVVDVEENGSLRFSAVNRSSEQATGFPASETIGFTPEECLPPAIASAVETRYRECIEMRSFHDYDETFTMHGAATWWRTTLTPLFDPQTGAVVRIVGVSVEITERKRNEDQLKIAALTDALTGLANRRRLERAFGDAVAQSARSHRGFGLILIDLDGFKPINDTFGHRKGDDVLRHVGSLLSMSAGRPETVARIGGDEFAMLVSASTDTELAGTVAALCRFLDRNLTIGDVVTRLGASVGAALWMGGQSFEDLMAVADAAMYRQKAGRRRVAA